MLILFSVILLVLQVALIIISHYRLLHMRARISRLTLVRHNAATMTVSMGVAALLATALVLEGIAPRWLLVGVGMAWISHVQAIILDTVLHLLDAERELATLCGSDTRMPPVITRGEGRQGQDEAVDC